MISPSHTRCPSRLFNIKNDNPWYLAAKCELLELRKLYDILTTHNTSYSFIFSLFLIRSPFTHTSIVVLGIFFYFVTTEVTPLYFMQQTRHFDILVDFYHPCFFFFFLVARAKIHFLIHATFRDGVVSPRRICTERFQRDILPGRGL